MARSINRLQINDIGNLLIAGTYIIIEANGRISSSGGIAPNSNVEGNIRFTGSITANSYVASGFGVPTISSATNINLTANGTNGGAVVVTNSPIRLRSYTTVDRGNITASAGDVIYNSTVNREQVYNGSSWGNVIVDSYWAERPSFRVQGSNTTNQLNTVVNGSGCLTRNNWVVTHIQGNYLNDGNGVFTAPRAGLYQINVSGRNSDYAGGISQIGVVTGGGNGGITGGTVVIMVEFGSSSSMNHAGASTTLKMAVNDTLACKILAGNINFDGNDSWSVTYLG